MKRDKQKQIEEVLQAMADANDGRLTPESVVQTAKDPDSPLHGEFEWDNDKAAHEHRLYQARRLIRSVTVIIKKKTTRITAPVFVRDPAAESDQQGYVDTRTVATDKDTQRDILIYEFRRARGVLERANSIAALFRLEKDVEHVRDKIDRMVEDLQEPHHV